MFVFDFAVAIAIVAVDNDLTLTGFNRFLFPQFYMQ